MSSSVLVKAYEISMLSLFDKPFGWGLNNFKNASMFYNDQTHTKDIEIINLLV